MPDPIEPPTPGRRAELLVITLGVLGVLVSYAFFARSTAEHGFVESWVGAFDAHLFSRGLQWDLVFSDLGIITIAWLERGRIGTRAAWLTTFMGVVLGVCAAIPTYWIARRRADASGG